MERKGSGLNKIIGAYQNTYNYSDDKKPQFLSSRVEFTVILKNLNYGSNQGEETKETTKERILELLQENPAITTKEIAEKAGISISGVEYNIRKLKDQHRIERIGVDFGRTWKVKDI